MAALLVGTATGRAWGQTLNVPLGTARPYALLSGGNLSTDAASGVYAMGRVGVVGSLAGPLEPATGHYRAPAQAAALSAALADAGAARAWCASLTTTAVAPTGQTLAAGAYTLTGTGGNVTLSAAPGGAPALVLTGDTASRFVLRVAGTLTLAGAVRLAGVRADHVTWCVDGNLLGTGPAALPGVVLVGGTATLAHTWAGDAALLAAGTVSLSGLRLDGDGSGTFFSAPLLAARYVAAVPNPPDPQTTCRNLVANGGFEAFLPDIPPNPDVPGSGAIRPTDFGTVYSPTDNLPSEVLAWRSANEETPDGYRENAPTIVVRRDLRLPGNELNCYATGPGQHTPNVQRGGAVGLYAVPGGTPQAGPYARREYIYQRLATPLPAPGSPATSHYYVEFWTLKAPNTVRQLNTGVQLRFSADSLYEPTGSAGGAPSSTSVLGGGLLVPHITAPDANALSATQWARTAGVYDAQGGERFVTLGNFHNDAQAGFQANTNATICGTTLHRVGAYFYLDDVLVRRYPEPLVSLYGSCTTLGVDCELPGTANATYTWTDGTGAQVYSGPNPFLTVTPLANPGPYTLSVFVPAPSGPSHPAVVYPPVVGSSGYDVAAGDIPNGLVITGPVVWNTNKKVHGVIRIKAGGSLTIEDGAVVEFDDTRQGPLSPPVSTRIELEAGTGTGTYPTAPGGRLTVRGGAVLRPLSAVAGCVQMWDGIVALGRFDKPQPGKMTQPQNVWQPVVTLDDCRIEYARQGVRAGKTTYDGSNRIRGVNAQGGAVVTAERTVFYNCGAPASFASFERPGNRSYFSKCTFVADAVLPDPVMYSTAAGVRYGTQAFVQLTHVRGVGFYGNTFQSFEMPATDPTHELLGIGIDGGDVSLNIECIDFDPATGLCGGAGNEFTTLRNGVTVQNGATGGELSVIGNTFRHCVGGVYAGGAHNSQIRDNLFEVGLQDHHFSYGLYLNNTYGVTPEGNTFRAWPGLVNTVTRGLNVLRASQNANSNRAPVEVYKNTFESSLTKGLYFRYDNRNVQFRCNTFDGLNSPFGWAAMELRDGQIATQGDCQQGVDFPTPDNTFLGMCTADGLDLKRGDGNAQPFTYYYPTHTMAAPDTKPECYSLGIDVVGCNINHSGTPCLSNQYRSRDKEDLTAELDTTTDAYKQQLLISELLTKYLTDTSVVGGLDSAIAILARYNLPAFEQKQLQLEERRYYGDEEPESTGARAAAPPRRKFGAQPASNRQAAKALRNLHLVTPTGRGVAGDTTDYFRRVLCALRPLRGDSVRRAALAPGTTLRDSFTAMAEDSLKWGSSAARAALNQYAGTNYRELRLDEGTETGEAARGTAVAPTEATAFIVLLPNPSTGHVRVGYGLAHPAAVVELRVFDQWGQPQGTYALTDEALASGVWLRLRAGIYHCQLVADGAVVAKERLLITK